MGLLDRFRKKDDGRLEFNRGMAAAELQGSTQTRTPEQEYIEMMRRAGFTIMDEHAINFFYNNSEMQEFMLIMSPINSLIKLSSHQAELKRIRLDNFCVMKKLLMNPKTYEANGLEVIEAVRMFGHDRISGSEEGWIGHITTENVRVFRTEEYRSKK